MRILLTLPYFRMNINYCYFDFSLYFVTLITHTVDS